MSEMNILIKKNTNVKIFILIGDKYRKYILYKYQNIHLV